MTTELELDHLFWTAICTNSRFQQWFLSRSKFCGGRFELKVDELWRQRWYRDPDTKKESETDITLTFRELGSGHLVSIHIENKMPHRAWERGQAENYRKRASNRMAKWKHTDCEVALMAPREHIANHPTEAGHFDFSITYEQVGEFVPAFAEACSVASWDPPGEYPFA